MKRVFGGEKSQSGFDWAEHQLEQRGGYLIIVARFIPGGRTAVTFSAGYTTTFPCRRFLAADVLAGVHLGDLRRAARLLRRQAVRGAAVEGPDPRVRRGGRGRGLVELVRHRRERRRRDAAGQTARADVDP